MKIYVDADSCPKPIKKILFRLAHRTGIIILFVANKAIIAPRLTNIITIEVGKGIDKADEYILEKISPNDLIITSDIPLAADVITKGASALDHRGELFTEENVRQRLNLRDFMSTMRASGAYTGGGTSFSNSDRVEFSNAVDRFVAKNHHDRSLSSSFSSLDQLNGQLCSAPDGSLKTGIRRANFFCKIGSLPIFTFLRLKSFSAKRGFKSSSASLQR